MVVAGAHGAALKAPMSISRTPWLAALLALSATAAQAAGPYAPAAGKPGSTAVSMSSTSIVGWATGYLDYLPGSNVSDTFKTPSLALGQATGSATDVVVLGDSGSITLSFGGSIYNGPGADLAVFENSFSDTFLELAWVEVSSDGQRFFRFPSYSLTPAPVGSFSSIDPTNINGLAGKYRGGYGTPFDLSSLAGQSGLDINNVRYVRIVDIVGNGTAFDSYAGSSGPRPIYDPYPTVQSGGFDLEAVGVMYLQAVPEPSSWALIALGCSALALRRRTQATRASA